MSTYIFPHYRFMFSTFEECPDRIDIWFVVRGELHQLGVDVPDYTDPDEMHAALKRLDDHARETIGLDSAHWFQSWQEGRAAQGQEKS